MSIKLLFSIGIFFVVWIAVGLWYTAGTCSGTWVSFANTLLNGEGFSVSLIPAVMFVVLSLCGGGSVNTVYVRR